MFDPSMMLFIALFAGVFALDIGVFDLFGGDDDSVAEADQGDGYLPADPGDEPDPDDAPAYDPAAYSARVEGTDGDDHVAAEADEIDVAYFMGGGDDSLIATDGDDFARGGAGNDTLTLRDGNDTAAGGSGNDVLRGGTGDDALYGQAGDDTLEGHGGDDSLFGGLGDDTLEGGYGNDLLRGGAGNDTISTDTLSDPAQMGRGFDIVFGDDGDHNIFLGDGDEATGGEGADTFSVFEVASPDAPPALITDFDATQDTLHVQYYARTDPDSGDPVDPDLSVSYDADANATSVSIFGSPVATLTGDAGIGAGDVRLVEII